MNSLPFRMVVLANFSGSRVAPMSTLTPIDQDTFRSVLASFHAMVVCSLRNPLASRPTQIEVRLPITSLRDFGPATLLENIPELATLHRFRELVHQVGQGQVDRDAFTRQIEAYRSMDKLAEPIRLCFAAFDGQSSQEGRAQQPQGQGPGASEPSRGEKPSAIERILDLVQAPETESGRTPSEVPGAIHEVVERIAGAGQARPIMRPAVVAEALCYIDELLCSHLNACLHHAVFQEAEATWRGLKFLVDRTDFRENIRIDIVHTTKDSLAETFHTTVVQPAYEGLSEAPVSVIVANFQIDNTPEDLDLVQRLAHDAEALQAPVIFSVGPRFFGLTSAQDIAHLSLLGARLDRPEYDQWRSIGHKDSARWLAAAYNPFLLRPLYEAGDTGGQGLAFVESPEGNEGYLWGNPVWTVASVMAGSVARVGWPTEITGRDSGLIADLAIRPYGGNDHEPIQIPLQAYVSPQAVQDLQDFGFMPLSCRPNSDVAFVGQAPTLYQPLGYSEKSTRRHRLLLQSLPYQLFAGRLAACVAHHTDRLITGKSPGEIEAGFEALLWNLVGDSGAGCQVTVRLERHPDRPEESLLVLSLRTGTRVLHGAEVELQVPVLLH